MCDIGDGFAAALAKSPLQSIVGHGQRSKGCSALSQAERDFKRPSSLPETMALANYGLVISTSTCDPSANFSLEVGAEDLRCWVISHNPSEQVLNQDRIGCIQLWAPDSWY